MTLKGTLNNWNLYVIAGVLRNLINNGVGATLRMPEDFDVPKGKTKQISNLFSLTFNEVNTV